VSTSKGLPISILSFDLTTIRTHPRDAESTGKEPEMSRREGCISIVRSAQWRTLLRHNALWYCFWTNN